MKRRYRIILNICLVSLFLLTATLLNAAEVTVSYTYDSQNRLTLATYTTEAENASVSYQYDALGNITSYSVSVENDTDGDGLPDDLENTMCTDPSDADTDDDGISDGDEHYTYGTEPCVLDTDGDGIQDGTELGITLEDVGPDTDTGVIKPDDDLSTETNPLLADTDGDGLFDGLEDLNRNGKVELGETDPVMATTITEGKLTFESDRSGDFDVWVTSIYDDGTTGSAVNLTADLVGFSGTPRWSPDGSKIAFRSRSTGTDQIWVMDSKSANKTQLTIMDGYYCRWPSWSPDGRKIAFYRHYGTSTCAAYRTTEVCTMNADGSEVTCFGNSAGHGEFHPSWSPDGTTLIYDRDEGTCSNPKDLWMMNPVGTNKRAFYPVSGQNDDNWYQTASRWGTHGKILFMETVTSTNHWEIGVINDDGTGYYRIAHPNSDSTSGPSWAFGNKKIIYSAPDGNGITQLWMVNDDETDRLQITEGTSMSRWADFISLANNPCEGDINGDGDSDGYDLLTFLSDYILELSSADLNQNGLVDEADMELFSNGFGRNNCPLCKGCKLAFTRNNEIFVKYLDGSHREYQISVTGDTYRPNWSPDGEEISYYSDENGNIDIFLIDKHGNNKRQLTDDLKDDYSPSISPDGNKIAYVHSEDGVTYTYDRRLMVMDYDGSNKQELVNARDLSSGYDMVTNVIGWSEDSRYILFHTSGPSAYNYDIWRVNVSDTGDAVQLTDNSGDLGNCQEKSGNDSWRNGVIIYSSSRYSNYRNHDIYSMNDDGSNKQSILFSDAYTGYPNWSIDGSKVSYFSKESGEYEIWIMNPDHCCPK